MTTPERQPNTALVNAREALKMTQRQLARRMRDEAIRLRLQGIPEIDYIEKAIHRCETGRTRRPSAEFYLPVFCAALGKSANELFGEVTSTGAATDGLTVVSHKFIPIFLGADAATQLAADPAFSTSTCEWLHTSVATLPYPDGTCTLTVFDFGVAVFHVVEELQFASISELALWRRKSYPTAQRVVTELLASRWPNLDGTPEYVLSAFWVTDTCWSGTELTTALRLICVPNVLLERDTAIPDEELLRKAEFTELVRLRDGYANPGITDFGIDGVSVGFASWAGVSYLPTTQTRAITQSELVSFETLVQALWCYTDMIARQIQVGEDPVVPEAFGWRFLLGCRTALTGAQPRESGQLRMMKDAILDTSRLTEQLKQAQEILRELRLVGR